MKLIELQSEIDLGTLAANITVAGEVPRSPGVHVSSLIRHIENTVMKPGQRKPYEELTRDEQKRMGNYVSMGWAWEEVLRLALRQTWQGMYDDVYVHPGEVELDGIIGTPDDLNLDRMAVTEYKATWRSSRRPIETDFWSWMVQMRAYCKMLGLQEAELWVFFVNGNYRESGPQLKRWHILFDPREIEETWAMLLVAKDETEGRG